MNGIFISYRRADSAAHAGRLFEALSRRYGGERVFYDFETITPGLSFSNEIQKTLRSSEVVLAVIGREWLHARDAGGGRRLEDSQDFVRIALAEALQRGKMVIPILVGGAEMPGADELPQELQPLARRHALEIHDASWREDVAHLFDALDGLETSVAPAHPDALMEEDSSGHQPWLVRALAHLFDTFMAMLKEIFTLRPQSEQLPEPHPVGVKAPEPSRPQPASVPPSLAQAPPPSEPAGHDVFVSYAKRDQHLAGKVARALEEEEAGGLRCWMAHRDIQPGEPSWAGAIAGAVAKSRLVVVIVSEHSVASKQVLREVTIADDENIPFIPFCVREVPLSNEFKYFFSTSQRLHAEGLPLSEALELLTSSVKKLAAARRRP